jgi:hypothetical protein
MQVESGELNFDNETDAARWLPPEEAAALLSYERDTALLDGLR